MPKQSTRKPGIHLHKTITKRSNGRTITAIKEWYWILIAKNGKTIARSSETYKRRCDAVKSIITSATIFLGGKPYELIPYYDHSQPGVPIKHC
jgi:hypothetical protein